MVKIAEGTIKRIRDEMFNKMQKLPIRYFDTHAHGDIMSHYTNDIDTLREFISRGIPQILSLSITITMTFIAMIQTRFTIRAHLETEQGSTLIQLSL